LIGDLIRQGVDQYLAGRGELRREERIDKALKVAGLFSSGRNDGQRESRQISRRSAGVMIVFLDTSGLYAVFQQDDANHAKAWTAGGRMAAPRGDSPDE
jgi:hypothetical protein